MKRLLFLVLILSCSVLYSQDHWYSIASNTQKKLNCIQFISNKVGFIGGNDTLLLKTTDGGKTWNKVKIGLANSNVHNTDIVDLYFDSQQRGYILLGNQGLYWTQTGTYFHGSALNNTNMCFKNSLYMFDWDNGFVGGSMCFQGQTITNKINTHWQTPNNVGSWDAMHQIENFDFLNQQTGMACGTGGYFFKTTDGGTNWDSIPTGFDTLTISDVCFLSDTLVYATSPVKGLLQGIIMSVDAGNTWQADMNAATFYYPGFTCIEKTNTKTFFGGYPSWGTKGMIFSRQNNGSWWYEEVDQPINGLAHYGDSTTFAVGDSGLIVTNIPPQTIGIRDFSKSSILFYPNPAEAWVHFEEIPKDTYIKIIEFSGKLVIQKVLRPSDTDLRIEGINPGIYILQIHTDSGILNEKLIIR